MDATNRMLAKLESTPAGRQIASDLAAFAVDRELFLRSRRRGRRCGERPEPTDRLVVAFGREVFMAADEKAASDELAFIDVLAEKWAAQTAVAAR